MTIRFGYPSDPPYADIAAVWATIILIAAILALVGLRRILNGQVTSPVWKLSRVAVVGVLMVALAFSVWGWSSIARRHFGDWRAIRDFARHENERILANVGGERRLTDAEYAEVEGQWRDDPKHFELQSGSNPVRPHLFFDYPYVGFDFGDGLVAKFAPETMLCIGAD